MSPIVLPDLENRITTRSSQRHKAASQPLEGLSNIYFLRSDPGFSLRKTTSARLRETSVFPLTLLIMDVPDSAPRFIPALSGRPLWPPKVAFEIKDQTY